ncbi:MAG: ABC transporter permease, partial [Opitutaceae bacterium]|nr:ABC transporter permease [Opitutaceae bacterium]
MKIPAKQLLFPAATGALMIAAWYAWHARLPEDSRFLLPTPDLVIAALREHREVLAVATLNTVKGALIGFGLAVVISTATALTLSLAKWIRASLYPYLMILQMTP